MSTSNSTAGQVTLPPGVSIGPGRQTSEVTDHGAVEQGMEFTLTLPDKSKTTVFVSYADLHDPQYVQELFTERVKQIQAITGG